MGRVLGDVLTMLFFVIQVAVKRAIPRRKRNNDGKLMSGSHKKFDIEGGGCQDDNTPRAAGGKSSFVAGMTLKSGMLDSLKKATWKKKKQDFVAEMRYISKIRHPNIVTVIGKCHLSVKRGSLA